MKTEKITIIVFTTILLFAFLFSACKDNSKDLSAVDNVTNNVADIENTNVIDGTISDETTTGSLEQGQTVEIKDDDETKPTKDNNGIAGEATTKISTGVPITKPRQSSKPNQPTTNPAATTTRPSTTIVAVESITLNESKKSLQVGENLVLNATIQPTNAKNKTIRWVSSNPDIVFVDSDGQVIALKKGKSIITCIANGGANIQATCEITVKTGALLSYLYDTRGFFYVEDDPWQRNFGFNRLYDIGAEYAVMYMNTVRVKFNYEGLDWMVQMWKGQYGYVFIGSEIGVYTKSQNQPIEHYNCASDNNLLKMQMTLYRNNKRLFATDYATYWWTTGFVPGTIIDSAGSYADRTELVMTARITLKDREMTNAFTKSLKANGFKDEGYVDASTPDTFAVKEDDVYFCWQYLGQAPVVITFIPVNGTPRTSKTMECGTTLTPPIVERIGHKFMGWSPEVPSIVPVKNSAYTAKWEKNSYTISFDVNGGTGSIAPITQQFDTSLMLPTSGVEKAGYTFLGWNTAQNATYALGSYYIPANDETLYAVYEIN